MEAALQQAARLAGPLPVGSHHLLLAALDDSNSAASGALASLGVDLDDLRTRLRAANVAGTSDEQPEQAGRRQMAIEVSDEMLHLVFTDPVMVAAGNEALRAVHAAAAREAAAARAGEGDDPGSPGAEAAVASSVIRGDHPAAAGLTTVWRALLAALATVTEASDPTPPGKEAKRSAEYPDAPGPDDASAPAEPGGRDEPQGPDDPWQPGPEAANS